MQASKRSPHPGWPAEDRRTGQGRGCSGESLQSAKYTPGLLTSAMPGALRVGLYRTAGAAGRQHL